MRHSTRATALNLVVCVVGLATVAGLFCLVYHAAKSPPGVTVWYEGERLP